jgi:8-oxo-dGTP pyrophosphatase MutT (NUDIX family)
MTLSVKAIVIYQNKVLLLKPTQADQSINGWDGPGGKVEDSETISDALKREVREETGIIVSKIVPLTALALPNNPVQYIIFLCPVETDSVILSGEHSEYKWVTTDEFKNLTHFDLEALLSQNVQLLQGSLNF